MDGEEKKERVTLTIPVSRRHLEMLRQLEREAKERGKSLGELLASALDELLEELAREAEMLPDLPKKKKG